jgi:hypothetical protein
MATGRALKIMIGIVAAVLVAAAVQQASTVFAPLALALFIIAIVWHYGITVTVHLIHSIHNSTSIRSSLGCSSGGFGPRLPGLQNANCFASRASTIARPSRDITTRRANQQNLSSPSRKNIPLNPSGKSSL